MLLLLVSLHDAGDNGNKTLTKDHRLSLEMLKFSQCVK